MAGKINACTVGDGFLCQLRCHCFNFGEVFVCKEEVPFLLIQHRIGTQAMNVSRK